MHDALIIFGGTERYGVKGMGNMVSLLEVEFPPVIDPKSSFIFIKSAQVLEAVGVVVERYSVVRSG